MQIGLITEMVGEFIFDNDEPWDLKSDIIDNLYLDNILNALDTLGHDVLLIETREFWRNPKGKSKGIDFFFNISRGYTGPNKKMHIPAFLDTVGIPYLGSDGYVHSITRQKGHFKMIAQYLGIQTPQFFVVFSERDINSIPKIPFPAFIKLCYGGASIGITEKSLVVDSDELKEIVLAMLDEYKQPLIVEEFIIGDEITVPIIGNHPDEVWGLTEVTLKDGIPLGEKFLTSEIVYHDNYYFQFPEDSEDNFHLKHTKDLGLKMYNYVGMRDYGRIDFRIDETRGPFLLEGSTTPHIASHSDFYAIAQKKSLTYTDMIEEILTASFKRQGIILG